MKRLIDEKSAGDWTDCKEQCGQCDACREKIIEQGDRDYDMLREEGYGKKEDG